MDNSDRPTLISTRIDINAALAVFFSNSCN